MTGKRKRTMLIFSIVFLLLAVTAVIVTKLAKEVPSKKLKDFKIIGYLPDWYEDCYKDVPYDRLTHINYAFAIPTREGTILKFKDPEQVKNLVRKAHRNQVKILLSIGGWSYQGAVLSDVFKEATLTKEKAEYLAFNIVKTVTEYNFDGADVDWEYPNEETMNQYAYFMKVLGDALRKEEKLFTAATTGFSESAKYQPDSVVKKLDWINIMAYDMDMEGDHANYEDMISFAAYWTKTRKADPGKVVIGVPFYARPDGYSYRHIVEKNPEDSNKDQTVYEGVTVYYNGLNTIRKKTEWACENLSGIMIWEVLQDSEEEEYSLLEEMYQTAKSYFRRIKQD
ncbi:MAG: hypothetical protein E7256_08495 [Lachnospiraceae bacterium]|nr:hypothetical protein [Lachnospiraceae bacterium]